jgi:hypothetical protein
VALQALHEHFWPGDGVGPEPPAPSQPGYAGWEGAVIAMAVLFAVSVWHPPSAVLFATLLPIKTERAWPKWLRRLGRRVERALPEVLWLLWQVARLAFSPEYARARAAVRGVATIAGFRSDRAAWADLGRRASRAAGYGENIYRHMAAVEAFGETPHKAGHARNACLELAYLALKQRGK